MSTNKKIKTDNNNKILQDIIDFEILKSIINYLLISKKNKNNNSNQYKINKFYFNRNEILNYILVSKKWCNFISLTISNNIINNNLFEHWLKINYNNNKNKSFIDNYNNQNQYDNNHLFFKNKEDDKQNKISYNKEFSIIKIKESIINDYFKFNLFLNKFEFDDFKEIKNKFENNQLLYNRIAVNVDTDYMYSEEEEEDDDDDDTDDKGNKKCTTELYLNNLSIDGFCIDDGEDEETVKIFKILKGRNLIYKGSDVESDSPTHVNYSALFDPDNSGQQVESIKVKNESDNLEFVEARHLIKVNQFENLHSITIPINPYQILSNLSEEMGFYSLYCNNADSGNSKNMKSELNQMINSLITCKSLKNLNLSCIKYISFSFDDFARFDQIFANQINQTIESYSNSLQPLFSELNTSIERIEFDCCGLLNINTFSNLLNNKSIKYLYLYGNSDFIVYSSKQTGDNGGGGGGGDDEYIKELHKEPISINQYLFENIFSSPLTSIRHYKIRIKESNQLKFIFNLILNNIFKLQLYSLIFELNENELVGEFVKEFKNLTNNISTQQQKSNNINLKEIKIEIKDDEYSQELKNINNPYFTTIIKKMA
ncbi:hypothetical protein ACTFIW_011032 [Dictyostelium discoideum]